MAATTELNVSPCHDLPAAPRPPRVADHVVSARQGDRTILLDLRSGRYFALDGSAALIWAMLEAGSGLPQIEDRLASTFDAPRERISRDLRALVDRLRTRGLVS